MTISNAVSTEGVTSFVQEACTAVDVMGSYYTGSKLVQRQEDLQNLTEYFARPRLINRGTLTTSRNTFQIVDVDISTLFNTYFPNGFNRLTGVYGIRFSVNFKLQVASTPFHQGVLAMGWQYGVTSTNPQDYWTRGTFPAACTNLAHVRLDISESTMAEIKIPFVHAAEFLTIDTQDQLFPYGMLSLTSIVPYQAVSGMNAPTYEVYINLSDLEFIGAEQQGTTVITPQSGRYAKQRESEEDARPLSSAAGMAAKAITLVGKGIPLLSSVTAPLSWFLEASGGALRAFGFSKPAIKDPIMRMIPVTTICEQNVDVASPVNVVGPRCDNELAISTGFSGCDLDEMALSYVLSQYSQICVGFLTTSLAHGAALYATNVSPSYFWFRQPAGAPYGNRAAPLVSGATANSFFPSHAFFIGQMFRLWRGGFKFRFTFGKTKMHGGRLLVSFNPLSLFKKDSDGLISGVAGPEITGSLVQPFGYSAIFDLRDSNVFEFEVPYTASIPYSAFNSITGGLAVTVIDPLQVTGNISTSVGFLVEVACMDDFEYAMPAPPEYVGITPSASTIVVQSGRLVSSQKAEASTLCIGERIHSLKQLIMLPKMTDSIMGATNGNYTAIVPPWFYQPKFTASPFPITTTFPEGFGFAGNIAMCYTWVRGSTDVHVYPTRAGNLLVTAMQATFDYMTQWIVASGQRGLRGRACALASIMCNQGSHHVKFPGYSCAARIPSCALNSGDFKAALSWTPTTIPNQAYCPTLPVITINNNSSGQTPVRISRSAGDDALMAHYIGPPPLALLQATQNVYPDPDILYSV
jgi:hypothetical protein